MISEYTQKALIETYKNQMAAKGSAIYRLLISINVVMFKGCHSSSYWKIVYSNG